MTTAAYPTSIYLVGAGGIGGWLANLLVKSLSDLTTLFIVDGDAFEEKNLDRQFCSEEDIGHNKAEALIRNLQAEARCTMVPVPEYLSIDTEVERGSTLIAAVDNHPARVAVLQLADKYNCDAILSGNRTLDADSMYYQWAWSGSKLDPRVYFPDLLTNTDDNPLHPGCTGEIQMSVPQLPLANYSAAGYAMQLLNFWHMLEIRDDVAEDSRPVLHQNNFGGIITRSIGDMKSGFNA